MKKILLIILLLSTVSYSQILLLFASEVEITTSYDNLNSFQVDLAATSEGTDSVAFYLNDVYYYSASGEGDFSYTATGLSDSTTYTFKGIAYGEERITKTLTLTTYSGLYFITSDSDTLKTSAGNYFKLTRFSQ